MRRSLPLRAHVLAVVAVVSLGAAPESVAADPPPAAVHQYRESIPGAVGAVVAGSDARPSVGVAPAVRAALTRSGGADAPLLEQVAVSPSYAAPQEPLSARGAAASRIAASSDVAADYDAAPWRPLAATLASVRDAGARFALLLALMLATAAVAVAARPGRGR